MILKPEIPEMCRNEIKDFLLELVQRELRNIPEGMQSRGTKYGVFQIMEPNAEILRNRAIMREFEKCINTTTSNFDVGGFPMRHGS